MAAQKRISKHWNYDSKNNVESFNIDELNETNLINQLFKQKRSVQSLDASFLI